jgi:uncharacterized membrane protein YfcA
MGIDAPTDPTTLLVLALTGSSAGAVNAIAGGGSLISFPALLALGFPPVVANVTNAVATVPGYIGGCIGYRSELHGQAPHLRKLAAVTVVGALTGSALLLALPESSFRAAVGWLVLASAGLMAFQPRIRCRLAARSAASAEGPNTSAAILPAQLVVSVYGGYFAAGLGIMMLAVLGMFSHSNLHRLNAAKSALSLVIGVVSACFFAVQAPVAWTPALILAGFGLIGGVAGVRLAKVIPVALLRYAVVVAGLGVGLILVVQNGVR